MTSPSLRFISRLSFLVPVASILLVMTGCSASSSGAGPTTNPPAAPTGVTATAGNANVIIAWSPVAGATSYNLYWSTTSGVTKNNGNKIAGVTSPFNHTGLSTTGSSVNVTFTPGTAAQGSLTPAAGTTNYTFSFPSNTLSQPAVFTIAAPQQYYYVVTAVNKAGESAASLAVTAAPGFTLGSSSTLVQAFAISANMTITSFNVPVTIGGTAPSTLPAGTVLNLGMLQGATWVDVATVTVGASGTLTENLLTTQLVGILAPGSYVLYKPASGTSTTVSNFGLALIADDGALMADGSDGLQVVHLYDANGNVLSTPTISYLDYASAYDLDGEALTPDGSQGIMVDGGNTVRFFSGAQTGLPTASATTLDISSYGGDGDSVAIMPDGNTAVVSGDYTQLVVVSGISAGSPSIAGTITVPDYRDGLLISNDGKTLLARGSSGLTVFSISSSGGSVIFSQLSDTSSLGAYILEDGRDGMAISPIDSTRAVLIEPAGYSSPYTTVALVTNLLSGTPTITTVMLPAPVTEAYSVAITPDGKNAIVGTDAGIVNISGVNTGSLMVGSVFALSSASGSYNYDVTTLGVTLDGKYAVVCDSLSSTLFVVPIAATGFSSPVANLSGIAVPYNDQIVMH